MIMVESEGRGGGRGRRREMLLFNDCLIWLERVGASAGVNGKDAERPPLSPAAAARRGSPSRRDASPAVNVRRHSALPPPRASSNAAMEDSAEKWEYKGCVQLVDLEVVVPVGGMENDGDEEDGGWSEEQQKLEVLSPEGSFVLYAGTIPPFAYWAPHHETEMFTQARPKTGMNGLQRSEMSKPASSFPSTSPTQTPH
jgi:hypothetical protein